MPWDKQAEKNDNTGMIGSSGEVQGSDKPNYTWFFIAVVFIAISAIIGFLIG
jgi:hypothetical protein